MIKQPPAVLCFLSSSLSLAAPIGPIRPSQIKDETAKKEQGGALRMWMCTEEKCVQQSETQGGLGEEQEGNKRKFSMS